MDADCLEYRGRTGSLDYPSWQFLEADTGIKRETLRACINGQKNLITDELAGELAIYFGFDVGWPEWRKGTAQAFKNRYRREVLAISSARRLPVAPTWHRKDYQETNNRLASLWVGTAVQGDPQELHVELACQPTELMGQRPRFHVRRGVLLAELTGTETTGLEETRRYLDDYLSRDLKYPVKIELGGRRDAQSWEFETSGPAIGIHSLTPICKLANCKAGARATFSFFIFSKHVEMAENSASLVVENGDDDHGLVSTNGRPLGPARKAILKLLLEKSLGKRVDGRIVLAQDVLAFDDAQEETKLHG